MSETDIFKKQNFGNRLGFGRKPALLVVDFTVGFNDADQFGGGNIDAAIRRTVPLLEAFRRRGLPVGFTRIVYTAEGIDAGVFCRKAPNLRALTESNPASQVVPQLAPRTGEMVVNKTQPSAFFGTALASWLTLHGVDTVVVTGCTTSGCVRASVVDAMSLNFIPIVPRDCVGDRASGPHEASLFDMQQKYADVVNSDEVIRHLETGAQA